MSMDPIKVSILENTFWLKIMQDHAAFILDALPTAEKNLTTRTREFQNSYMKLWRQLTGQFNGQPGPAQLVALNRDALDLTTVFSNFQKELLVSSLTNKLNLHLSPTSLNHMFRESKEYLRTLQNLLNPRIGQTLSLFDLHLLWLPSASGHAAFIRNRLDPIEHEIYQIATGFKHTFDQLILKTAELNQIGLACIDSSPIHLRVNQLILKNLQNFREFLLSLKSLKNRGMVLGAFNSLTPDHMARETAYYIAKIEAIWQPKEIER